ncbi:netrin receptor UNC5C isoform X2 [Tribolium castaneum]|uniref:netrin receptor UNC5C isoform X2 n=1 Tax=Tribolium castaneum TaxID=7070 RepID=UPI00077DC939|nr:PREDICTED: netrin receptor UNC5C isoform X2 [Tribolium castaneum]|eukprot:XP_015835944.1 PREDICTED: netrin receptor UNC5C isoform X2 [Tribolium castaneum]
MAQPETPSLSLLILAFFLGIAATNQDGPYLDNNSPTKSTADHHDESLLLNSDSLPIFLEEPQDSYVVKNRPAVLKCRAAHALKLYFKCNGAKNVETSKFEFVDPQNGVRIMEAETNVSRDMVEEFFGKDKFKCECYAWSGRGSIKSQSATIDVAYMKKTFEENPMSTRVEMGHQTELRCVPPVGVPPPRIYWLQGAQPLQPDTSVLVSTEGHLLIGEARAQDTNNYTCVAENIAAKRMAQPAEVIVYVNGGWSPWSPWTECRCPGATLSSGKMSTRTCTHPPPSNGGLPCQGLSVRKTKDCITCPQEELVLDNAYDYDNSYVEPARWSQWSEWSHCNSDCLKTRRRQCIPGNGQGRRTCNGKDTQTTSCTSEQCRSMELSRVREANLENTKNDIAIYIGVTVAVFFVSMLSFFLTRMYWKKNRHQSLYNMASNDYHPEFFPEQDKKSLSLQPDLTQTVPPCYEYPYTTPATSVTRSVSEHHYDVPHLTSGSDIQMSPATSSTLESSSGKRSQLSGFTNNLATESVTLPLPTAYAVTPTTSGNYTSATVTHSGAFLNLLESGVSLVVPEGAISRTKKQELFLSILNEDCFRPKLAENLTQLSPVVSCGPNISLNKSVVLRIPHCAELSRNNWSISVLQSDCSDSQWQNAVTLGQETINTSVFCQLDKDAGYLVTDCLSRFVIVGQSTNGMALKRLKLAVFAPKLCFQSSVDYSIRVYVLEDTDSSMETVFGQEKRLGGYLLDEPRSIVFQDGGNNLCLTLDSLSEGWKTKPCSNYQEIPFRHLWQASSNSLHCSFTLESYEISRCLNFKIRVNQKGFEYHQTFDITCRDDSDVSVSKTSSGKVVPKIAIQSEAKKVVDFGHSPKSAKFKEEVKMAKNLLVTDRGVSTCDDFNFRLSRQLRKQLCQCLDPPTPRGNDWRMLAHALSVDRYINFFATKPSPTDCILDLWEARNRQSNALTELKQIFSDMERFDAVNILDNCLGPNWL